MFCTSGQSFTPIIAEKAATDLKLLTNLREATHRILYNFTNSAAMNGLSSTVEIVAVNTWYNNALMACMIISGILTAVSGLMMVVHTFGTKKEEK
jgi:beta-glucosidase